jgi:hypothetical protein
MRRTILVGLGAAAVVLAWGTARVEAFGVHNRTHEVPEMATAITVKVRGGGVQYDTTLAPGRSSFCDWRSHPCNPALIPSQEPRARLTATVEAGDFTCQVPMEVGGYLVVWSRRRPFDVPPELYCESWSYGNPANLVAAVPYISSQRDVRFLATADPQFWWEGFWKAGGDPDKQEEREQAHRDTVAVHRTMKARLDADPRLRGILVAGDLTENARIDELQQYRSSFGDYRGFLFDGLGNHDYGNEPTGEEVIQCALDPNACRDPARVRNEVRKRRQARISGRRDLHYSWDWHDVHFVQLNLFAGDYPTSDLDPTDPSLCTADPMGALSFLATDLELRVGSSRRPVVLIQHYGWDNVSLKPAWWQERQREELWRVIAPYNVIAFFTGHAHAKKDDRWIYSFPRPASIPNGPAEIPDFLAGAALYGVFLEVEINERDEMIVTRKYKDGSTLATTIVGFSDAPLPPPPVITFHGAEWGQVLRQAEPTWTITGEAPFLVTAVYSFLGGFPYAGTPVNLSGFPGRLEAEGVHEVVVKAVDKNHRPSQNMLRFSIDRTSPVLSLEGVGGSVVREASPVVTARDEFLVALTVDVDGRPLEPGETLSAEGRHVIIAEAFDRANNTSSARWEFTIDRTPPAINVRGLSDRYTNRDVALVVDIADPHPSHQTVLLNGAPFTPGTVVSADGDYLLQVVASDAAGNLSQVAVEFTIDKMPPAVLVRGFPGRYTRNDVTLTVQVTDRNLTHQEATLNGQPFTSGTVSAEGDYHLHALGRDAAGNEYQIDLDFTIDKTPPELSLTGVSDGQIYFEPVTPSFVVSDRNLAEVVATLGPDQHDGSPVSADGVYSYRVAASDKAGNLSVRSATFEVYRLAAELSGGVRAGDALVLTPPCRRPPLDGQSGCPWPSALAAALAEAGIPAVRVEEPAAWLAGLRSGYHDLHVLYGQAPHRRSWNQELAEAVRLGASLLLVDDRRGPAQDLLRALGLDGRGDGVRLWEVGRGRVALVPFDPEESPERLPDGGLTGLLNAIRPAPRTAGVPFDGLVIENRVRNATAAPRRLELASDLPAVFRIESAPEATAVGSQLLFDLDLGPGAVAERPVRIRLPIAGDTFRFGRTLSVVHPERGRLAVTQDERSLSLVGSADDLRGRALEEARALPPGVVARRALQVLESVPTSLPLVRGETEEPIQNLVDLVRDLDSMGDSGARAREAAARLLQLWQRLWSILPEESPVSPDSPAVSR